ANLLGDLGRFAEARALNQEALALVTAKLSPDHRMVAIIQSRMAFELFAEGHSDEAIALQKSVLDRRRASSEPLLVADWLAQLGTYLVVENPEKAAAQLEESLALLKKSGSDNPSDRAGTLTSLGEAELALGKVATGRSHLEEALRLQDAAALRES